MAYGKQTMWPEYWFIVPTKQILNLYKFLRCWFPEVYGHFDLEEIHEMGMELVPEPEIDFLDEVRQNIILDFTDDINFSDRPDSGGGRCGQHQHGQPQSERDPQDHDSQQHRHGPLPPRHVRAVPALLGRPAEASVPPHPASDPGTHLEPRLLHAHARLLAGLAVPRVRAAGLPGAAGGAGHGARRVRRLHLRAAAAQRQVPGNRGVLALHILPIIQGGSFDTSKNRCIAVRYSFIDAVLLYSMRIMHHYLRYLQLVCAVCRCTSGRGRTATSCAPARTRSSSAAARAASGCGWTAGSARAGPSTQPPSTTGRCPAGRTLLSTTSSAGAFSKGEQWSVERCFHNE